MAEKNWLWEKVKATDKERIQLLNNMKGMSAEVDKKVATGMKPSEALVEVVEEQLKLIRKG